MIGRYRLRTPLGGAIGGTKDHAGPTDGATSEGALLLTRTPFVQKAILGEAAPPSRIGILLDRDRARATHLAPTQHPDLIRIRFDDDAIWTDVFAIPATSVSESEKFAAAGIDRVLDAPDPPDALRSVAVTDRRLAAAAAWLFNKSDAIRAAALLHDDPAWPVLFAGLQSAGSGDTRRFDHDTRHLLAPLVARYGWSIGRHSYGAPDVLDHDQGASLSIGSYCSMNSFTAVLANHATRAVTTYPFRTLANWWPTMRDHQDIEDHVGADIAIGNDVWVGRGVIVLPGTIVGDGAILGANTVARGTIPPYSVVVGNPGTVAKRRFSDLDIKRLLEIRWWDWPDWLVDRFSPLLSRPDLGAFFEAASGAHDMLEASRWTQPDEQRGGNAKDHHRSP